MLPLIMAACGAAGAVAGVVTTCATKEQDRQAIKRYEKVNAELINSRDKLQQRYYELADRSKQQINELNLKLVESEMEKDVVYLALELYQELMELREDIDINPSFEVLVEFHKAIVLTNYVLKQLDRRLVPVTQDYFKRTLTRIDERDDLSKEQLFGFMAVLMNPQEDTVSSLLGEVQNKMFSERTTQVEQQDASFNKGIAIEPDNEERRKLQDENQWIQAKNANYQKVLKETLGRIEVRAIWGSVAGCYVISGKVVRDCYIRVCRNNKVIYEGSLDKLKRMQEHVREVKSGDECGVGCSKFNDWQVGDIIEAYLEEQNTERVITTESEAEAKERTISSIYDEVKDWGERGQKLFDLDCYEEALACYKKAINAEPDNDEYWEMQARNLSLLKRNEEALESIEKAISLDQDNDEYWRLQGWILTSLEMHDKALESVEKAISLDQENDEHWCLQGRFLTYLDRDEEALLSIKKAIYLNRENDENWCLLGKVFLSLEDNNKALKSLEKAISINPDNDESWYLLSKSLSNTDKCNEALESVNKAIALESDNDEYYFLQACLLEELDLNTQSLTSIDKAIEINSQNSFYWYCKSELLSDLKKYEKALVSINQAIELDSDESDYWSQKSYVTYFLKKYGESLNCAEKAIALNPTNSWNWYRKSAALYLLDREKEAFNSIDKAMAIDPDNEIYREFRDEMLEYLTNKTEEPTDFVDNVLDKVFSWFD